MTSKRTAIAAPPSQFRMMRMRKTTKAIGSAAEDGAGFDMVSTSSISNINTMFIDKRQVTFRKSIRPQKFQPKVTTRELSTCSPVDSLQTGI
jgi:hypothetical protein